MERASSGTLCPTWLGEALPWGSESPVLTAAPSPRMQAYSLRSHQAVVPPANRKLQCLGLGLAFSVYGLFPVINLEPEGRVIAGCSGAGSGAGGGDRGGMWAMP